MAGNQVWLKVEGLGFRVREFWVWVDLSIEVNRIHQTRGHHDAYGSSFPQRIDVGI